VLEDDVKGDWEENGRMAGFCLHGRRGRWAVTPRGKCLMGAEGMTTDWMGGAVWWFLLLLSYE
jgi:hypothetical protein